MCPLLVCTCTCTPVISIKILRFLYANVIKCFPAEGAGERGNPGREDLSDDTVMMMMMRRRSQKRGV